MSSGGPIKIKIEFKQNKRSSQLKGTKMQAKTFPHTLSKRGGARERGRASVGVQAGQQIEAGNAFSYFVSGQFTVTYVSSGEHSRSQSGRSRIKCYFVESCAESETDKERARKGSSAVHYQ